MKITKIITLLTFVSVFTSCVLDTSNSGTSTSTPKTKVEDVKIKKEYSNAWAVTGMIRNESSTSIKGSVKIKFINSNGDITQSVRAYVNDGDPLKPGQGGNFEYFLEPEKFTDIVKFDVIFIEIK